MENKQTTLEPMVLPAGFSFVKHIGTGGGARISLIARNSDRQTFALKTPLPQTKGFDSLASREVQITSKLNHPSIARARLLDPRSISSGILLPFFPGEPLNDLPRFSSTTAIANLISSISVILYYLELRGVIHGDLKPHNILAPEGFTEFDFAGSKLFFLRLIDFSMGAFINRPADCRLGVGTLGYSSPETTRNGELVPSSDIFSLGVIAYWLCSGLHPFIDEKAEPAAIASAVREYNPAPLDTICESVSPRFSDLVQQMLSKEPALRPQNGFALCEELEACGGTFPFRRAIQPRHLLESDVAIDVASLATLPGLKLPARNQLHRISGGSLRKIRLILGANFRRGGLRWENGQICASDDFAKYMWPKQLISEEQELFRSLSMSEAKWVVRGAVCGAPETLLSIEGPPDQLRPAIVTTSITELIRPALNSATVVRQSARLASKLADSPRLERELELCATLFTQARQLKQAFELTSKHCDELTQQNREIEALPLLEKVEALADELQEHETLAQLLQRDGDIRKSVGDMIGAETRYLRVVEICREERTPLLARTYKELGDLYKLKREYESGFSALEKARELYEEFGDTAELARVANNIGLIYWIDSKHSQALSSFLVALHLHRQRNDLPNISSTVNNIGIIYATTGRLTRAIRIFRLSLAMKRELGDRDEIARTLNNLGHTQFHQGDIRAAVVDIREALEINTALSSKKEMVYNLDNLVSCEIASGNFREALIRIREGRQLTEELHDEPFKAEFDVKLALVFKRLGQWRHSERLLLRSLELAERIEEKTTIAVANIQLADLYMRAGQSARTPELLRRAIELSREVRDPQVEFQALALQTNSEESILRGLEIAREVNSIRDLAQGQLIYAGYLVQAGQVDKASQFIELCKSHYEDSVCDVHHPLYWRIVAEIKLAQGGSAELVKKLEDVLNLADRRGEKADSWLLRIAHARVCLKEEEFEIAYKSLRSATKILKELTDELPGSCGKREFLEQPAVRKIGDYIRELQGRLNIT